MKYEQLQNLFTQKTLTPLNKGRTMEKVIRTYTVTESRETLSVQINGPTTDLIEKVVLTDEEGDVVCNQTIRTTVDTAEARAVIEAAAKGA